MEAVEEEEEVAVEEEVDVEEVVEIAGEVDAEMEVRQGSTARSSFASVFLREINQRYFN